MLSEGDLVEYHIPLGGYGHRLDRVGMLGLVVKMGTPALPNADLDTTDLCQVLWAQFEVWGPQWEKIKHLRAPRRKLPGSLEALGEGGSNGGR